MTTIHDPNFILFGGEPVTGRVAPRLYIYGEMTPEQRGAVAHIYKLFRDVKLVSPGDYLVQNRKLSDGTRVRMVALQGQDHIIVWPTGGELEIILPHGFAVVTNWTQPKIFKRKISDTITWAVDSVHIPQAVVDIVADNQIFRLISAAAYVNVPLVLNDSPDYLWDYKRLKAPSLSTTDSITPIRMPYEGQFRFDAPHYVYENKIVSADDLALYTMTLSSAILIDFPEMPQFASATTADGNKLAMQHIRRAIISPTTGIYTVRCANERLTRTASTTYEAAERNDISFNGPIGGSSPLSGPSSASLGEAAPELPVRAGTNNIAGSGFDPFITWVEGFEYLDVDITAATEVTENATREETVFSTSVSDSYMKTLALSAASEVEYPELSITNELSGSVLWRAGFKKWFADPDEAPLFGERWFGTFGFRKNRIDTVYGLNTTPVVQYKLGWADLSLLEGQTSGQCTGSTYIDEKYKGRDIAWWDGFYLTQSYICVGNWPGTGDRLEWIIANDIKPSVDAELAPFQPYPTGEYLTAITTVDDRPVNTGSYTYNSRHVIDYDHKGQFYAAIRVQVVCTGAEWREDRGVYDGYMAKHADPFYVVTIFFESNWRGVTATTTLVSSGSVQRPAFEFVEIPKQNPYYFLLPTEVDKQTTILRVPPGLGVAYESMVQLKTLCLHQGTDSTLACADVRDDLSEPRPESTAGIEYSKLIRGYVRPHRKYVTGQLYARTFKLSDFPDALWLLHSTKCDAKENDGSLGPDWFYMPDLKAAIDSTTFRVEVRDGVHEHWSDEFMPDSSPPDFIDRVTKLYRV